MHARKHNKLFSYGSNCKRIVVVALIVCISPIILYSLSFLLFFPFTADRLVFQEEPQLADAIVLLEGESRTRVEYAISLLERQFAKILLFPGLQLESNKQIILDWQKKTNSDVTFLYNSGSTSTYEEAMITREYVKDLKISTLLLVTSSYHSYRAAWIFKKVLPNVRVISTPVPLGKEWFSIELVNSDQTHINLVKREQEKFFFYFFIYGWRIY